MSASSDSLTFRLLLLLTPCLLTLSSATVTVSYRCIKRGDNPLISVFVTDTNSAVYDIYGKGAEKTCGKRANNMTGSGTAILPYTLLVDLSGVGDVTDGICGINKTGNVADFTLVIQESTGTYSTSSDRIANIRCNFSNPIMVGTSIEVPLREITAQKAVLNLTLTFKDSATSLNIGDDTYLDMRLWNVGMFNVIKAYRCWAMRNANDPNKVKILDNYCPVKGAPVTLAFKHNKGYSKLRSDNFKIFRFVDSEILMIRCAVDVCTSVDKCAKFVCSSKKKRSLIDGKQHLHLQSTDAMIVVKGRGSSKLFSKTQLPYTGTLFPIAVFIIIILAATVVGLVLTRRKNSRKDKDYHRVAKEESDFMN